MNLTKRTPSAPLNLPNQKITTHLYTGLRNKCKYIKGIYGGILSLFLQERNFKSLSPRLCLLNLLHQYEPTDYPDFSAIKKKEEDRLSANFNNGLCTQLGLLPPACLRSVCVRSCVHGDDPPSIPPECVQCAQRQKMNWSTWGMCLGLLGAPRAGVTV